MGGSKPKPVQTPFENKQQTTNTYGRFSVADSPEAQEFLNTPLDFGSEINLKPVSVDPGVGRRTDLASQAAENRANSALSFGVPRFIREANAAKEQRDIRDQGAAEAQQAEYANQMGNNQLMAQQGAFNNNLKAQRTAAELERRRLLLPQYLQTGGSGSSSGYNTQLTQPQPGFLSSFGAGLGSGIGGALAGPLGKI